MNIAETSEYRRMHEYNGYSNKPTWLISLWIDNDQSDSEAVIKLAKECLLDAEYSREPMEFICNEKLAVIQLADMLEEMHSEWKEETVRMSNVFSDLLNFSLAYVNWEEIAEMYIEEAKQNMEEN